MNRQFKSPKFERDCEKSMARVRALRRLLERLEAKIGNQMWDDKPPHISDVDYQKIVAAVQGLKR